MTPADRAARVRIEIERRFSQLANEFLDRIQDIIAEALIEHEVDVRCEHSED
jgi:hypothetical protein